MDTVAFGKVEYERRKNALAEQISASANTSSTIALQKNTSNLFRHRSQGRHTNKLDVRAFNHVISVDKVNLLAEVEGMTTYAELVAETLRHGCLPTVVPELKSITIGGALSGVGIESSSFRYGLVHEGIVQFDALLSDGRVVDCRPDNEYQDLFYAFPNSYGTLGYALKVTVRLFPVKPYVKLHYLHFGKASDFFKELAKVCTDNRPGGPIAFVDGVAFAENHLVLITGEMVNHASQVSNYKHMHIYYRAVAKKKIDFLTVADYIWRWDPDWFWCSKVFGMQNKVMRFLFGKWVLKSTFYSKLMRFAKRNRVLNWFVTRFSTPSESVIQDVAIPIENAVDYLQFFQQKIGIKPVWICPIHPLKTNTQYPFFKMDPDQLYVNFGFWDMVPSKKEPGHYNRLIEKKVLELGGNKSLYSNVFYSPDEFWRIYDKAYYDALKNKYDAAKKLSTLYDKCTEKK